MTETENLVNADDLLLGSPLQWILLNLISRSKSLGIGCVVSFLRNLLDPAVFSSP